MESSAGSLLDRPAAEAARLLALRMLDAATAGEAEDTETAFDYRRFTVRVANAMTTVSSISVRAGAVQTSGTACSIDVELRP